jgi:hypothetical protein
MKWRSVIGRSCSRGKRPGTKQKTRHKAGFVECKDERRLSGRMGRFRSARARSHAGGHAGAGQDDGVGARVVHGARIMPWRSIKTQRGSVAHQDMLARIRPDN